MKVFHLEPEQLYFEINALGTFEKANLGHA